MSGSSDPPAKEALSGANRLVVGGEGHQVLSHVTAGGDVVLGDQVVIGNIEQLVLQSPAGTALWTWPKPYNFSTALVLKRKGFTGRGWLIEQVRDWYRDPAGARSLLLVADYGVGKSAFMAELTVSGAEVHALPIVAHHFCDRFDSDTLTPGVFLSSLAAQLALALPGYREAIESDAAAQKHLDEATRKPMSALMQAILNPLQSLQAPDWPLLLLIDGLDETLGSYTAAENDDSSTIVDLLARLAESLPPWLRLLATSRPRQEMRQALAARGTRWQEIDAEQVGNLEDIQTYVEGRSTCEPLASQLAEAAVSPKELAERLSAYELCGGKFIYAVRVLDDLASPNRSVRLDRLEELPRGMDTFYRDAFRHRFKGQTGAEHELMRRMLGLLCVVLEPLDVATLTAILGVEKLSLLSLLSLIEDFLCITPATSGPTYAFDHISLAQWLSESDQSTGLPKSLEYAVDLEEAYQRLTAWALAEADAERAHSWLYLCRHLPAHLPEEQRQRVFSRLLLDLRWLQARLEASDVNALLNDWHWIHPTYELSQVEGILRQAAHVFRRKGREKSLPSQLLARWPTSPTGVSITVSQRLLREQCKETIRATGGACPLFGSLHSEALEGILELDDTYFDVIAMAVLQDGRLAYGMKDGRIALWDPYIATCTVYLEGHSDRVNALVVLPDGRLASGSMCKSIKLWDPNSGECIAILEGDHNYYSSLIALPDGRLVFSTEEAGIMAWDPDDGSITETLEGHFGGDLQLVALPDGRLASGSIDSTIKLWDLETGTCTADLEGHSGDLYSIVLLPDGQLAYGSSEGTIELLDPEKGRCLDCLEGHSDGVYSLLVLPDGRLVSGSRDGSIKIWESDRDGRRYWCTSTLEGSSEWVRALAVLPDGRLISADISGRIQLFKLPCFGYSESIMRSNGYPVHSLAVLPNGSIASSGCEGVIRLWDPDRYLCTATLASDYTYISCLVALPDGRLASGDTSGIIRLRDPSSSTCGIALEGHIDSIGALLVLHDGLLASGSEDGTIKLWDLSTSACTSTLEIHSGDIDDMDEIDGIKALAVLPDGRIASGHSTGVIRLWDLNGSVCTATLDVEVGGVSALAVLSNGLLVSGSGMYSSGDTIKLWNLSTGTCTATLEGHPKGVYSLVALSDGRLATGGEDGLIKLWDGGLGVCTDTLKGHSNTVNSLVVLPDGRLASASTDGSIRFWERARSTLQRHSSSVSALEILPNGHLASASCDHTINIWDPVHGTALATLRGHTEVINSLSMLQDGHLASASNNGPIMLWNLERYTCLAVLNVKGWASAIKAMPNGNIVAGTPVGTILVLCPKNGRVLAELKGHSELISGLAVLSDTQFASASRDNSIRIWNLELGICSATLEGHSDRVLALSLLIDGQLASCSSDGTIKLWDPNSGLCTATFEGQESVSALAVLPGDRLASGCDDGTIKIWDSASGERGPGQLIFVADAGITALAAIPLKEALGNGAALLVAGDSSGRLHWLRLLGPSCSSDG